MRDLRSSTTGNGWTINFDDIAEIVMEVRGGLSEISMEQVEDTILALGKLGYLKMPNPEDHRAGEAGSGASSC